MRNFSSLDIGKKLEELDSVCGHWFFGTCSYAMKAGYRRCVKVEVPCPMYKRSDDKSEIINELVLRAVDDYAMMKTLWFELSERHFEGETPCQRHKDCVLRWKPRPPRIHVWCDTGIDTNVHFWHMLRLMGIYEAWKHKLSVYK